MFDSRDWHRRLKAHNITAHRYSTTEKAKHRLLRLTSPIGDTGTTAGTPNHEVALNIIQFPLNEETAQALNAMSDQQLHGIQAMVATHGRYIQRGNSNRRVINNAIVLKSQHQQLLTMEPTLLINTLAQEQTVIAPLAPHAEWLVPLLATATNATSGINFKGEWVLALRLAWVVAMVEEHGTEKVLSTLRTVADKPVTAPTPTQALKKVTMSEVIANSGKRRPRPVNTPPAQKSIDILALEAGF